MKLLCSLGRILQISNVLGQRNLHKLPTRYIIGTKRENVYEKALDECRKAGERMKKITDATTMYPRISVDPYLKRFNSEQGDWIRNFMVGYNRSIIYKAKPDDKEKSWGPIEDKCENKDNCKKNAEREIFYGSCEENKEGDACNEDDPCYCPPKKRDKGKKCDEMYDRCEMRADKKGGDPCKKDKDDHCNDPKKREERCKKKDHKKHDKKNPCKKDKKDHKEKGKSHDPCKKDKKSHDPCKKDKKHKEGGKSHDPCKKDKKHKEGEKSHDPCKKDKKHKEGGKSHDPCKKVKKDHNEGGKSHDPCKKDKKSHDPCKKDKKHKEGGKSHDPCKKDEKHDKKGGKKCSSNSANIIKALSADQIRAKSNTSKAKAASSCPEVYRGKDNEEIEEDYEIQHCDDVEKNVVEALAADQVICRPGDAAERKSVSRCSHKEEEEEEEEAAHGENNAEADDHDHPDILKEVNIFDSQKLAAAEALGDKYKNKEYYAFNKTAFYDMQVYMTGQRGPPLSAKPQTKKLAENETPEN